MNSNAVLTGAGLPANCGFPVITITGFSTTGCCSTFPKIQGPDWTQQIIDNLSWTRGKHALKFGGEWRKFCVWPECISHCAMAALQYQKLHSYRRL